MKLLLDSNGAAVLRNGMPVYQRDDGREVEFDGAQAFAKIGQLTGENTTHRKRAEELEAKLKGIPPAVLDNIDAAASALETIQNIDAGKLIAAGKVEEIKAAAAKAAQEQVAAAAKASAQREAELSEALKKRTDELYTHMVGGNFASSEFITKKCEAPVSLLRAAFGGNFKVEEGKTVGYDASGNKIFSVRRPGEVADFDEAIEVLVHAHPDRDRILKGSGASGSGATPSGGTAGGKTASRAQFEAMGQQERMAFAKSGGVVSGD